MRDRLWAGLSREVEDLRRNGSAEAGLPNTLSVGIGGVEADTLLAEIGDALAASAGAACHAAGVELSTVLEAMRVPMRYAMGTVRFSVGRGTTEHEIDEAVRIVAEAVRRLRPETGAGPVEVGPEEVKLTRFTHGMGCACKLRPQDLEQVLRKLPKVTDPAVLVDAGTSDDAAVYRLRPDLALVTTVDFFTPIADDPFDFGAISAANSLSDVYAMGAKPLFALSVVGFPSRRLPLWVLERILEGASEVAREAGIFILGGHTVDDTEPKFGLAVTGVVHPDRVVSNATARAGDVLVLTKPIGTGILATAVKRGLADEDVARRLVAVMRQLNKAAAEAMEEVGAHACTDVTGFGLLGHLREMAAASRLDAEIEAGAVPVLAPAREMAAADVVPGGRSRTSSTSRPSWTGRRACPASTGSSSRTRRPPAGSSSRSRRSGRRPCSRALRARGVAAACRVGRFTRRGRRPHPRGRLKPGRPGAAPGLRSGRSNPTARRPARSCLVQVAAEEDETALAVVGRRDAERQVHAPADHVEPHPAVPDAHDPLRAKDRRGQGGQEVLESLEAVNGAARHLPRREGSVPARGR